MNVHRPRASDARMERQDKSNLLRRAMRPSANPLWRKVMRVMIVMKLYKRKKRLDHQVLAFGRSRGEEREKRLENVCNDARLDVIACLTIRASCFI